MRIAAIVIIRKSIINLIYDKLEILVGNLNTLCGIYVFIIEIYNKLYHLMHLGRKSDAAFRRRIQTNVGNERVDQDRVIKLFSADSIYII
ncbi:hypothetical protein SDC9_199880 [bioreactor metagenome]|uniref:Uncharacterized protein n=1 Tax=bioreactor metagenome TaxID=1076179 RepID=A0A645IV03_9ZZZZ